MEEKKDQKQQSSQSNQQNQNTKGQNKKLIFGREVWNDIRKQWCNDKQKKENLPEGYEKYDNLPMHEKPYIYEIINAVKAPYKPFKKYVNLKDLVETLEEVWEESD